ncbi:MULTISPECIES: potassium-transporting ATPase subunit KdpB [unclassified Halomonas]|uniref:potassium-transporting ATPase subunit KdpB n=1 Tax=unclassified Halomonas TaxID=2609666 RepID=UPI000480DDD0|nr:MULTISPECIES: potassium-transporting ATPase subunit KdpB [unclassified Halomonas]NAO97916.1 potassium-transporting ATPase subunit KdpB [Halomonas sp. MG34]PKH60991.1 K(+)-transporting ATPase subunit B [Halomonas sp. Choline-3u-9]QGQ70913.1 potassium-transporting ATPase subunit KdpB [Halomonas sp. PA16-9]
MSHTELAKQPRRSLPIGQVVTGAVKGLAPHLLARNPVMAVVAIGTVVCFGLTPIAFAQGENGGFALTIALLLLATVLFATGAESLAESRGKAHAGALRKTKGELKAAKLNADGTTSAVTADSLRKGDRVKVVAGELIPADGDIVEGAASINESAVTGESAPVLREAGTDNSGVSAGTKVLSDQLIIEVSANPGESLLDRMIALVEGASRQKTPSELALSVLLAMLTLVFLIVVVTLVPMAAFVGVETSTVMLVALLVCLIPTTIGGLLPAIGIAGMERAMRANLVAKSGKAVEIAGSIDTLLLDKTGTITLGDRRATEFAPCQQVPRDKVRDAAFLTSLEDPTPEGRSIVALATEQGVDMQLSEEADGATFEAFSAETRLSGVDLTSGKKIRKGAPNAIAEWVRAQGGDIPSDYNQVIERISRDGATPIAVAENQQILGVVALSDVIKSGIAEKFAELRAMGIKTVMITGDNPITASAIAATAGVDDYIAEATPERKLALIREEQASGRLVAMVGDGTNDAPALAQADLGLAMNSGTQAAREAANMVDLDSDPGKLISAVEIGKQLLVTRGALTTFSLANDVAKYFVILPALFAASFPALGVLDVMNLHSPTTAVLAAVLFNALIIPALIPFALRGVSVKAASATVLLRRNLLIYGLGGLLLPFPAIKLFDMLIALFI